MGIDARLDWKDIKKSAYEFVIRFKGKTKESSYKQLFWAEFLKMFGVDVVQIGAFEYYVKKLNDKGGQIDYFWPGKVIIEHKSAGKDLDAAIEQSYGYLGAIEKKSERPQYLIVSDFKRIRLLGIADGLDVTIPLEELPDNIEKFGFLAGYSNKRIEGQHPVNIKAAEIMGKLYDMLNESGYPSKDLNCLLIRLVFCLFAEDADIFDKNTFSSYICEHTTEDGIGLGGALNELFSILDTPIEKRQKRISSTLSNFPYVNGGLFADRIEIPQFDRDMRECLLKASSLDWKFISPAIFGSLFQCIMDTDLRRELGAHYTSEENILKLINPLFMDGLRIEFEKIKTNKKELYKLWDKIASIRIMDPACGCGNFLIVSYREMRLLEMDILEALYKNQMIFDESHLHIDHFYGMEIDKFASMVANLSIILMDHLMNKEMSRRFGKSRDIVPLKETANIVCCNSLTNDWNELIDSSKLSYIIGNPPFRGKKYQTKEQKEDMEHVFGKDFVGLGTLDYVSAWYKKAFDYMDDNTQAAFVSTNSVVQGEHVPTLWKPLFDLGMFFTFAHRSFLWKNEAKKNAAVYCVIIGFSKIKPDNGTLYDDGNKKEVKNISPYLTDSDTVFLEMRSKPICNVPSLIYGSFALDDGKYTLSEDEYKEIIYKEPMSQQFIKLFLGSEEFINSINRYCVWLKDANTNEVKKSSIIMKKIKDVEEWRSTRTREGTKKAAKTPMLFAEIRQPDSDYLAIPITSSENRKYIPIGYLSKDIIASNHLFVLPNATYYEFGIIASSVHMAWMRTVAGRMKQDYNYSNKIVYNNFPWPKNTSLKEEIEKSAKDIISTRQNHPNESLAQLYDPLLMPEDLMKAHEKLDKVVCKAYGFDYKKDESTWVAGLMKMYKEITSS